MDELKNDIIIRQATHSDNDKLVLLASITPMNGKITIRVDRSPDFFHLLEMRGDSIVMIAESDNAIIGSISATAMNVFINGNSETAYYLADLKVHPEFRQFPIAHYLAKSLFQKLDLINADLVFCSVVMGNQAVKPFMIGKAFWQPAEEAGQFHVLQIIPTRHKINSSEYALKGNGSTTSTLGLLNNFTKHFQFGPVYSESSFENVTQITASANNKIVATLILSDVQNAKQEVLIELPAYLKIITFFFRKLPKQNKVSKILYIKAFACEAGHEKALEILIAKARNLASEKNYHFLTIGIHEKNPLLTIFSKHSKFTFRSMLYVGSLKENSEKLNDIKQGIPFEDFSLV